MDDLTSTGVPIRAVLFDLGNTLVHYYELREFQPILARALSACTAVLKLNPSAAELRGLLDRALALNHERPDHAVRPLRERLDELFHPNSRDQLALEAAFLAPIFEVAQLDPDAVRVLQAVRAMGMKIAIVSNTPWGSPARAWREELGRHALDELVDAIVFCVDVGFRKPHAAPFLRALELISVAAAQAVFVGDDADADGIGAQRAGLTPLMLERDESATDFRRFRLGEIPRLLASVGARSHDRRPPRGA